MWQKLSLVVIVGAALNCGGSGGVAPTHAIGASRWISEADSILMDRRMCFGTCARYEMRIARSGDVRFQSWQGNEVWDTASATVSPRTLGELVAYADRVGFFSLPEKIDTSRVYCPVRRSDGPYVTVTVFAGAFTKKVGHYTGCESWVASGPLQLTLPELLPFYMAIDSVARANQWIPPMLRRVP